MKNSLMISVLSGSIVWSCATIGKTDPNLKSTPKYAVNSARIVESQYCISSGESTESSICFDVLQPIIESQEKSNESYYILFTKQQREILNTSDRVLQKFKIDDEKAYHNLVESSLGFAVVDYYDLHTPFGALANGKGIFFDNISRKIKFMYINKLNGGFGVGFFRQYAIVVAKSKKQLDKIMYGSSIHMVPNVNINFMIGNIGTGLTLIPGYYVLKTYHYGFDIGYQWGSTVFKTESVIESRIISSSK